MKTAKLIRYGKGWRLEGEKTQPVPGDFGLTEDMNGQEVEYDNFGGPVKLIRFNGKDYTKIQQEDMGSKQDHRYHGQRNYGNQRQHQPNRYNQGEMRQENDPARAPYNFVPLNERVTPGQEKIYFNRFAEGRLSGHIDFEISALSDIFIRGKLEKFFSINGNYAIPGSSLRGLIRSLLEIASYSRMEMVEKDRKFFFRNISDPFYKDIFLENRKNGDVYQKSKPGWLSKSGNKFFLQEVPKFYKVNRRKLEDIGFDLESVYTTKKIWFDPNTIQEIHQKEIRKQSQVIKRFQLFYNKVSAISRVEKPGFESAILLITGLFGTNKHFQWIIPNPHPDSPKKDVTSILQEYEMDESRDEGANLIKALRSSGGEKIPCFFISDEDGVPLAIGHTGIFRYPYKHQIGNAIKQQDQPFLDMAKSIFGFADNEGKKNVLQAGKVYFEDALATEITGTEFGALRILSSPKPTSFQHYLEQPKDEEHHWGVDNHKIRGYKQYWHSNHDWRNPDKDLIKANTRQELIRKALEDKAEQFTVGEVLNAGSKFQGRLRFINLTKQELGALLFTLDLPEGCAHKLGMGKPLGLGSVKITPTLILVDRQKRYSTLFTESGEWETGELKEAILKPYKDAFAKYIGEKLGKADIFDTDSYWARDERMKELKHMLTLEHNMGGSVVNWNARTRYMEIEHPQNNNEYKGRPVLPKPSEVVNPSTYKKD